MREGGGRENDLYGVTSAARDYDARTRTMPSIDNSVYNSHLYYTYNNELGGGGMVEIAWI